MIEVEGLVKRYGYIKALAGVTFTVGEGEIVGLVGPNGAGKTSTIKSIVGLVRPDSGKISVDGRDPLRDASVRRLLGYVPETPMGPRWASVCEILEAAARLDGLSAVEAGRAARDALGRVGLEDLCSRRLSTLSKGQRKRVMVAQALVVERRYYLLDEPFTGIDPEWVAWFRNLIFRLARDGAGILVSSHILRELQDIIDRVVIIARGRVVFSGTLGELAEKVGSKAYVVVKTPAPGEAAKILEKAGLRVEVLAGTLRVEVDGDREASEVIETLRSAGVDIESFEFRRASLEEAYLRLVGGGFEAR